MYHSMQHYLHRIEPRATDFVVFSVYFQYEARSAKHYYNKMKKKTRQTITIT